jgi:hypothetical protein
VEEVMTGENPFGLARDGDSFPLASSGGTWVIGRGTFSAFQFQSLVTLFAAGTTRFNYEVKLVASPLTVFPPQFGLFFLVPEIVLPAERPFAVDAQFFSKDKVSKITCWDADGRHEVSVVHLSK